MPVWKVQDDDEIVEMTEEKLRKQLRKGDLSGTELARPEGDSDWKPLHDYPVFKEEVPHTGDSGALARRRLAAGLVWHALPFLAMGFAFGWPWWMAFWGMGVAAHAAGVLPKIVKGGSPTPAQMETRKWTAMLASGVVLLLTTLGIAGAHEATAPQAAPVLGLLIAASIAVSTFSAIRLAKGRGPGRATDAAAPAPAPVEAKSAVADPYLAELEAALTALEKQAAELGKMGELGDLPAIKKAALSLHKRRLGLLPLCDPQMRARLDKEQDDAIAAEEKADVPMTKDVYRQQALALQQRIDAIDEASAMAARLEARERTLLHQVENLRLQLARAGVEESATPSLAGDIERINRELAAETEVAEVSRGRLGTAAIPKKTM